MAGPSAKCGTYAGFMHHRNSNQPICPACRAADALYKQDRRQAPRRRAVLLEALAGFDKYPTGQRPKVTISVYPTVSRDASLALGNGLEWDGAPPYEWRREYLTEWDGGAA